MKKLIDDLRKELNLTGDEKTKQSGQRFFREEVKLYGIRSAVVTSISRNYFKTIEDKSKTNIFNACEELLRSGMLEESFIACNWSYYVRSQYQPSDLGVFEQWINKYVNNWATCDTLCNHTVGSLVDMYPETLAGLKSWSGSENRWMKRASAVSLIVPAKKGRFLKDIFEIAEKLLTDKDDMVQKGYGWMLKAASQSHLKEVFDFVIRNEKLMPRTSFRYAIEKMPAELKAMAMKNK